MLIALLADIPDLFDVKMDSSPTDCSASRFTGEGSHEPVIDFVKKLTGHFQRYLQDGEEIVL